jgi:hypothetical protein
MQEPSKPERSCQFCGKQIRCLGGNHKRHEATCAAKPKPVGFVPEKRDICAALETLTSAVGEALARSKSAGSATEIVNALAARDVIAAHKSAKYIVERMEGGK